MNEPEVQISWEDLLGDLPKKQSVKFARICAILAAPFLGARGNFDFWEKNTSQKYLYSILNAIDAICDTAAARAADAALAAAGAVRDAARAAADADADADAAAAYAAYAAYAAAACAAAYAAAAGFISNSKGFTDKFNTCMLNVRTSILDGKPLPAFNAREFYGKIYDNFQKALKDCGCEYWADVYDYMFANNFEFDKNELQLRLQVPGPVKEQGAAEVAKHIIALRKQGEKETKEARIILIGSKGAGKTSLSRKLRNAYFPMPRKEASTAGVNTSKLKLIPNETTHLWDFGGHVIIQSAHKCFMSAECVYVLVIDGRTEQGIDEYRKWLSTVKTYSGGKAQVFIVLNKVDSHSRTLPERLSAEFPGLIAGFYPFNIKRDKKKLREFKSVIKDYVEENFTRKLPKKYFNVKQELEKQFKKYRKEILENTDVQKIVSEINLEGGSKDVLNYLNTLGVALSYDNIPDIVLNPSWISNGIYTIINHMQDKMTKGYGSAKIHKDDLPKIFKRKETGRYGINNCKLLGDLMVKYELAFPVEDEPDTLLVPAVLSANEPSSRPKPDPKEETLVRKYSFNIMLSESIFPRYIQRNHNHIEYTERNGQKDYILWRGGMSLFRDKARATVTKDDRVIEITVWGENKSDFLRYLHNKLEILLKEHYLQWDSDEIKLSQGYYTKEIIREVYDKGLRELGGENIETVSNKYSISLINIKNASASLINSEIG